MPRATRTPKPEPTWELVLKRNPVERIKREKAPLGIRDELPALIAAGYESVPEEDIVRLQWWGLYHDKPKIGTFMLRVKLPSGHLTPAKLRAIGEVSNTFGRGDGELATRQNIQLHWLELARLPDVFAHLDCGGDHDCGRVRRHGSQHHRLPRPGPRPRRALRRQPGRGGGGPVLLREPGLLRSPPQAQVHDRRLLRPLQRAGDQLHRARRRDPRADARDSPSASAAGSRRCRGSHGTWASSSPRRRPSRSSARSRAPGRRTSATASPASRPASSS